jgi:adenosyl cobinamide kinase/adenosyl cobinamide phosphate guanylyltransferase
MAKVLGLKQLLAKKYKFLEGLPEEIVHSFGKLTLNFIMFVWGGSGNGKSNFMMQFLRAIMPHGKVLYVALEEGFEATTQMNALRQLEEELHTGKIEFADHEMTYMELVQKLSKKKSPRFIVIDSIQYWAISYEMYRALKEKFKNKTFIFISHAKGKEPDGTTAQKIRYDAGVKVRIEGLVAFIVSRYGGNNPYVIWEEGAKKYWQKNYKKVIKGLPPEVKTTTKKQAHEKASVPQDQQMERSEQLVLGDSTPFTEVERALQELASQAAQCETGPGPQA